MNGAKADHFKSINTAAEIAKPERARRIELIRQCANEHKAADFEDRWMSVLRRCAEWHSSIVLRPDLYREPGGAFRWTVELAFYSMRLASGQKFGANLPSEKRRRVEPQYNYGVFLAAVCSGLDEPHRHFLVTRISDKTTWNPSAHGALNTWLADSDFTLTRRETPLPIERMRTGVLAQLIVGQDLLASIDPEVLAEIFGAINPNQTPSVSESLTHKVVREAVKVATDFDLKAQRAQFEPVEFKVPPAIDVANALQPVVESVISAPAAAPSSNANESLLVQPAGLKRMPEAKGGDPRQISLLDMGSTPTEGSAASVPATPNATAPQPKAVADEAQDATQTRPRIEDVLKGAPLMIQEFFKALEQDVSSGKAAVAWGVNGLIVPKKLLTNYGISPETLIDVLRKRSMLRDSSRTELTFAPTAGELILARPKGAA
ncbi:MAG: TraI domain-containing protein [Pseudomonadota bacterium]